VFVKTDEPRLELVVLFQFCGAARVFAENVIDVLQDFESAKRDVFQIADGSGNDREAQSSFTAR
jgi:hypothetical protein